MDHPFNNPLTLHIKSLNASVHEHIHFKGQEYLLYSLDVFCVVVAKKKSDRSTATQHCVDGQSTNLGQDDFVLQCLEHK